MPPGELAARGHSGHFSLVHFAIFLTDTVCCRSRQRKMEGGGQAAKQRTESPLRALEFLDVCVGRWRTSVFFYTGGRSNGDIRLSTSSAIVSLRAEFMAGLRFSLFRQRFIHIARRRSAALCSLAL